MNEEEAVGQVTSVPAFSRMNRQNQNDDEDEGGSVGGRGGGDRSVGGTPVSTGTGKRRAVDRSVDPLYEGDEDEDDDEDDDDGGLNELQDVNESGEVEITKGRRGGEASSTSVGVGSGRIRGIDYEEEEEDEEGSDDLYSKATEPKRGSSSSKSKGARRPVAKAKGSKK
jgi:hypothetical protein